MISYSENKPRCRCGIEIEEGTKRCPACQWQLADLIKHIAALVLILVALGCPAKASDYTYDFNPSIRDEWVTQNLIRLGEDADQARREAWLTKLGCWTESIGSQINVVCCDHDQLVKWLKEPRIEQLIMVPINDEAH